MQVTKRTTVDISPRLFSWRNLAALYVICVFALPQYFGVPLPGFALTALRLVTLIILAAFAVQPRRGRTFLLESAQVELNIFLIPIFLVYLYTAIAVKSVNSVAGFLADNLAVLYILVYLIRHELGVESFLKLFRIVFVVVCLVALYDMLRRTNLFECLRTIKSIQGGSLWRGGSYRVAGMGTHPIGFGMYLILMLPVALIDPYARRINLVRYIPIAGLAFLVMLGTGSRGPQACLAGEILIFYFLTDRNVRRGGAGWLVLVLAVLLFVVIVFSEERHVDRWVWMNLLQIVDQIFGTHFTLDRYGYWQYSIISNSTEYRDYLPQIFFSPKLNPLLGQGNQGDGVSFTAGGYFIQSVDNFYVLQYIRYAWPGVISTLFCFFGFIVETVRCWASKVRSNVFWAILVAFVLYFMNLWTVADLGTFKYLFAAGAVIYAIQAAWYGR